MPISEDVRALLERDAAVARWLREEVVPGHREHLADPLKPCRPTRCLSASNHGAVHASRSDLAWRSSRRSPNATSTISTSTSPAVAAKTAPMKYVRLIADFCKGLATFPMRGTAWDDLPPGLRVTGFERRVTIAFVVTETAVLIEGIFYGGPRF